jgi:hypothetical protein
VNTTGVHIPLWLTSSMPEIGWGQKTTFPDQEGAFFGNIFVTDASGKVPAYFCEGATQLGLVPGRIGADQPGSPYRDPWGVGGLCNVPSHCSTTGVPTTGGVADGYAGCSTYKNVVTVWRNSAALPVFNPNLRYSLKNLSSGKVMDWDDAVTGSTVIQQWTNSSGPNQLWRFLDNGNGTYRMVANAKTTKCVELPVTGPQVRIADCNGAINQAWTVRTTNALSVTANGQYFKFFNAAAPSMVLEVPGASVVDGTRLDVAAFTPARNQVWSITVLP